MKLFCNHNIVINDLFSFIACCVWTKTGMLLLKAWCIKDWHLLNDLSKYFYAVQEFNTTVPIIANTVFSFGGSELHKKLKMKDVRRLKVYIMIILLVTLILSKRQMIYLGIYEVLDSSRGMGLSPWYCIIDSGNPTCFISSKGRNKLDRW